MRGDSGWRQNKSSSVVVNERTRVFRAKKVITIIETNKTSIDYIELSIGDHFAAAASPIQ